MRGLILYKIAEFAIFDSEAGVKKMGQEKERLFKFT